jgi:hypothetical protein
LASGMVTRPVRRSSCWNSCSSLTALAVGFEPLAGPRTAFAVLPPLFAGPDELAVAKPGPDERRHKRERRQEPLDHAQLHRDILP